MEIYLIYSNETEYESENCVIGYKTTKDEAISAIESLKKEYELAREFNVNSIIPAFVEYQISNVAPTYPKFLDRPKWPSGIKITKEMENDMEDARDKVKSENNKILKEYSELYAQWQIKHIESINSIIEPVLNEPWFVMWFEVGDRFINCNAHGLAKGAEYIYELCEELK